MDMERIKEKLLELVKYAEKDRDIIAVFLFGSVVKNKEFRDVDICLVLERKMPNLEMSKKRIEYLELFPEFDIQIFQQLPIFIRIRVLKEGKCLLCKNEDHLYDLVFETIKKFEDFRPYYKSYLEGVLNG